MDFKKFNKKQKSKLKFIYEETYKERLKKTKNPKKARISAKAKLTAEALKMYLRKPNIIKIWEKQNKKIIRTQPFSYIKENVEHNTFKIGNIVLLTSIDENLLNLKAERKGIIRDIEDEFESEVIHKVKQKYDAIFHPDMYYVIKDKNS